jgi:hypothetical protein
MKKGKLLAQVLVVLPSLMLGDVKIGLSRRGRSSPVRSAIFPERIHIVSHQ